MALQNNTLSYDECPAKIISKIIPNSILNKSSPLSHILYNEIENTVFIIFTGTSNACMAAVDLSHSQTELDGILNYTPGLKGHHGIYDSYLSIRPQLVQILKTYLVKNPKIVISGHSLGGGLSQICALDLAFYNPIHYSFAAPLIFNQVGAAVFDKFVKYSYRVVNLSDVVTFSPFPVMPNKDAFCYVGKFVYFQRNMGDYSLNHTDAYVHEFDLTSHE